VNPAGLATIREASVHFDLTVGDPGSRGRLRQVTADVNSRGLSFGYQHDVFDGGVRGHTYRLGLAGGSRGLAAGFAASMYRGDTKGTGIDLGVRYEAGGSLILGAVLTNLREPTVRGFRQGVTFLPGLTLRPLGPDASFSALARLANAGPPSYAFGARVRWGKLRAPLQLLARLDTDHALRRGAFAFGLSIGSGGGANTVGAVVATPGDVGHLDAISLYGVATRSMTTRR